MERLRKIQYHKSTIASYKIYINDRNELQESSMLARKSPDEVRAWYAKAIEHHSAMLARWERATIFNRPSDPGLPPGP